MAEPRPHAHRPLSPRSLKEKRWSTLMHACGRGFSVSSKGHPDHPGFVVSDRWDKKTRRTTRRFLIQGDPAEYSDLREAGHAWNALYADPCWAPSPAAANGNDPAAPEAAHG